MTHVNSVARGVTASEVNPYQRLPILSDLHAELSNVFVYFVEVEVMAAPFARWRCATESTFAFALLGSQARALRCSGNCNRCAQNR
jgi:hypothetical protein